MTEKESDILLYLLISNLNPPKKIFELINTSNQEIYLQAHEILNNYINLKDLEEIKCKRIKIPMNTFAFHIYITKEELLFISYSNQIYFSTELNFGLFEEIEDYLKNNVKRKINEEQSFLIENEKDEIKDIINACTEEFSFLDSLNTIQTDEENKQNNIINNKKNESNDDNNNIIKINNNKKNEQKKENSKENLLKNTIVLNKSTTGQSLKSKIKTRTKFKNLVKSINLKKSKMNNKIKFKLNETIEKNKKNKKENKTKLDGMNYLLNNKPDCCNKIYIIVILSIIVAIEIIATVLIIYFSDNFK